MASHPVTTYSLTGDNDAAAVFITHALELLKPHLPVSLPLYRRLQFGRFFDTTALLTNLDLLSHNQSANGSANAPGETEPEPHPWLLAFTDRSCRPETEVWLFASWETASKPPSPAQQETIDGLVTNLVKAMEALPSPPSIHQDTLSAAAAEDPGTDTAGFSRADYGGHAADSKIMLWGAIHERTVQTIERLGLLATKFKTGITPNHAFVWDVDALGRWDERALPAGLTWGELGKEDFELVRARTQIPRQDRTLAALPNVGIFCGGRAIVWAFVGLDGSLTTLHVEKEYRGKGLAKAVTTKLLREKMGHFWEEGTPRWAGGYVVVGNAESEGMCRSLGGRSGWMVYWLRVDLSVVE